uniref:Calciumdependent protein kinase putative n=1 Tax=Albugo laibachii Nc14 TaxID=890382 RepID=F0WL48_9STRA|nr:calciumdependent protein kinase putative [Albugo laibachii Nc14]|eukprot:CCA22008.1 calciumdependent protein kinase putative [Albugo laibachii Nc14]
MRSAQRLVAFCVHRRAYKQLHGFCMRTVTTNVPQFGSIRKEWHSYMEKLHNYPLLQHVAANVATFFTEPNETDLHFPRNFHEYYQLDVLLGEGAYGSVFRVIPKLHKKRDSVDFELDLAVKIIPKKRIVHFKDYITLHQEVHMMALLSGTLNVVHLFGAYEDNDAVYLVLEHCLGGDVASVLKQSDAVGCTLPSEVQIATFMTDIFHVVWQCHLLEILHGDLKLDNFLFATPFTSGAKYFPFLKLTDFGGACFLRNGDTHSGLRGTPLYTAPEVLTSSHSLPADLWSCGVILHWLLSGNYPFTGPLLDDAIVYQEVDLTTQIWSHRSAEAKELLYRLLEKDPTKRMTALEALHHPWLTKYKILHKNEGMSSLNGTMVQRLQFYRSLNRLQQAVFLELSHFVPIELREDVVVLFTEYATTKTMEAQIGIRELVYCFEQSGYTLTLGEVKACLNRLDLNSDGYLSLDEFCTAFLDWAFIQKYEPTQWKSIVDQVYKKLDRDSDGFLSLLDLSELHPFKVSSGRDHSSKSDLERCFRLVDTENKGWITLQEFEGLLHVHDNNLHHYPRRIVHCV